jgi:hypothetical protein
MAQYFFISTQYVKENSIIDENVDEKYIKLAIQRAQRNKLIHMIGSGLYNEIAGEISAGLTALNTTLMDTYVAPLLLNLTLVELTPYMAYKFSNRNVGTKESTSTTPAELSRLDDMMKIFDRDAENDYQRMRKYLLANIGSYPLYNNAGSAEDTIYPRDDAFDAGIKLDRADDCILKQKRSGDYYK